LPYFIDFIAYIKHIGIFFASFLLPIDSNGEDMRFLTSKTSLFFISLVFISIFFWMNFSNLKSSTLFTEIQASNSQQNQFLTKLGDLSSRFFKWVYEFSQPFAAETGRSLQAWWEVQKVMMINTAVQWLINQQDNLSSSLQSLLTSVIGNSATPH